MPLATFHLLRLSPSTSPTSFLSSLRTSPNAPSIIIASRPRFLVIRPTHLDTAPLASQPWDLLLLLLPSSPASSSSPTSSIPASLHPLITATYNLTIGIPSRLLASYPSRNAELLRAAPTAPLTGSLDHAQTQSSSQNLELSPDLARLMAELETVYTGPVTQLNLLQFQKEGGGKESYAAYGRGFVEVAGRRGGDAKIVGNVVRHAGEEKEEGWDEISLVHYASIRHFCDMLAGPDYQEINAKYRLGALKDTVLMCTTELDLQDSVTGAPKL
ncbi:hypothetical protein EV356DRAFT_468599 [Viridothelium virens]|uniref:EthD domain-containing protein n=1 Tax=Viridothelium virens TaxID=1048519 RepID=A0A6A6H5Z0_VIRVR|nr:hypothetical protein EV356DRAFT_468599 [Viridothelium virens]